MRNRMPQKSASVILLGLHVIWLGMTKILASSEHNIKNTRHSWHCDGMEIKK